ncbi:MULTISPECIES: hypothetical protein [Bacillus]|nr:hypothetical protein [Bacillus cereus group sp. BfR-BA-01315]
MDKSLLREDHSGLEGGTARIRSFLSHSQKIQGKSNHFVEFALNFNFN